MEYRFVNNMNKPYKKNSEVGFDVTDPISNPEFYLKDLHEYVAKDIFNKIKLRVLRHNGYVKVLSIESVIKRADEIKFSRFTEHSRRPFYSDLITFLTEYLEDVYRNEDTSRPNLVDSNGIDFVDDSDTFNKEKVSLNDKSLPINENKIHSLTNEKLAKLMDFETNNNKLVTIDKEKALKFIDELIMGTFLEAEKKALAPGEKFHSAVRCAAFCELLYQHKHIKQTGTKQRTMNDFAKLRYGWDIKLALATSKKDDRKNHKDRKVMKLIPLNKCF